MKKTNYLMLFFLFSIIFTAMGQAPCEDSYPTLILTKTNKELSNLEFKTACVSDTTKVAVTLIIRWEENLDDMVAQMPPGEIYVSDISYSEEKTKNNEAEEISFVEFPFSEEDLKNMKDNCSYGTEDTPEKEKCLIEELNTQFRMLFQHQPYGQMSDITRFYGSKGFTLTYPVILVPE